MAELSFPHHNHQNDPGEKYHELIDDETVGTISSSQPSDVPNVAERLHSTGVRKIVWYTGGLSEMTSWD